MMELLAQTFLGLPLFAYLRFGIIILFAWLLKGFLSKIISRLAYRLFKKNDGDIYYDRFVDHINKPFGNLIFAIFAYISINQIAPLLERIWLFKRGSSNALAADTKNIIAVKAFTLMDLTDRIFFFIIIITATSLIVKIVRFLFRVLIDKAIKNGDKERQQLLPLLRDVLRVVIWGFMFFVILGVVFNVNVVTLIAGLGMGGIAVAFALKDSLENLLSSFMIMLDKPFIIGDLIKIDGVEGNVEKIGFRSTHIRTAEKTLVSLPNRNLISNSLENFSERGARRVKMVVGATYGLSKQQLQTILEQIASHIRQHPETVDNPNVFLDSFGDSALNINVSYFVKVHTETPFDKIKEAINFDIYEIMYQYGAGFPYPTQATIETTEINNVTPGTNP
ncbi:mechanosensitive ion channel protein MscS [Taibaiella sp. KBW10]|uniref:mechanosensitive ion channel family protein n=1 Tax=Taibaiella sp. KBW10 TaxID=2153357 RepID=UPI000F5A5E06|nr:mechanosensitive ion channel family protein [Taibaiella sp. KBW10]RQO32313.1 mechanosensitive ion channel protein MscS [Taibaiella sp. KBW10]